MVWCQGQLQGLDWKEWKTPEGKTWKDLQEVWRNIGFEKILKIKTGLFLRMKTRTEKCKEMKRGLNTFITFVMFLVKICWQQLTWTWKSLNPLTAAADFPFKFKVWVVIWHLLWKHKETDVFGMNNVTLTPLINLYSLLSRKSKQSQQPHRQ